MQPSRSGVFTFFFVLIALIRLYDRPIGIKKLQDCKPHKLEGANDTHITKKFMKNSILKEKVNISLNLIN